MLWNPQHWTTIEPKDRLTPSYPKSSPLKDPSSKLGEPLKVEVNPQNATRWARCSTYAIDN